MTYEFRELVGTVKELAEEIKLSCDAYSRRELTSERLSEIIIHYATRYPDKLYHSDDRKVINSTIKKIIGTRRLAFVEDILSNYQILLFRR